MKTIFVVDDNNANLIMAEAALSDQYNVFTLASASVMFELLEDVMPDLILLDIMMPEIDGFEALKQLKANPRHAEIPVMFLTGRNDSTTEVHGFEMGVMDFITKPFSGPVLLNRVKKHLALEDIIRERTEMLQQRTEMLQQRTEKLIRLQNSMSSVLADLVETRGRLTSKHIERTSTYLNILLNAMLERGVYQDEIKEWDINVIVPAIRLHDLGKIVVTDLILNKPGKLTTEEFELIKLHSTEGEKIIDDIIKESGDETFLDYAKLCAGSHHEKWNGSGYPRGLKGGDIPLLGRIMAIADVYDALVSDRPYKKAFTHEKAIGIILDEKGRHFDPQIVDVFLEVSDLFAKVE